MIFFVFGNDNSIYINARYFHKLRINVLNDFFNLYDDFAAAVFGRLGDRRRLTVAAFMLHSDIAVFIGISTADKYNINRTCFIKQAFLSAYIHNFNDIFGRNIIKLSAFNPGIGKRIKADVGERADFFGGDITVQLGKRTLRQIVCFNFILHNQFAKFGRHIVVAGDNSINHAFMGKMIRSAAIPIALPGSI